MKKKLIEKILTSKSARGALALSIFAVSIASVAQPWDEIV